MEKNTNYWTKREELLIKNYVTSTTERDKNKYLKLIQPRFNEIFNAIFNKYFYSSPYVISLRKEIMNEAFTEIMLRIFYKYDINKSAFTYISSSVKYFIYSRISPTREKATHQAGFIDDTYYQVPSETLYEDKEDIDDLKYKAILHLEKLIKKNKSREVITNIVKKNIKLLTDMVFFLNNNEEYSLGELVRYLLNKNEGNKFIKHTSIEHFFRTINFDSTALSNVICINGRDDDKKVRDIKNSIWEYDDFKTNSSYYNRVHVRNCNKKHYKLCNLID